MLQYKLLMILCQKNITLPLNEKNKHKKEPSKCPFVLVVRAKWSFCCSVVFLVESDFVVSLT